MEPTLYELDEKIFEFIDRIGIDDEIGPYGYILERLKEGKNILCILERLKEDSSLEKTGFIPEQIDSYLIKMGMGACFLAEIENEIFKNRDTNESDRKQWEEAYFRRGVLRPRISVKKAREVIDFLEYFDSKKN
jgi:hypothetical protein